MSTWSTRAWIPADALVGPKGHKNLRTYYSPAGAWLVFECGSTHTSITHDFSGRTERQAQITASPSTIWTRLSQQRHTRTTFPLPEQSQTIWTEAIPAGQHGGWLDVRPGGVIYRYPQPTSASALNAVIGTANPPPWWKLCWYPMIKPCVFKHLFK